MTNSIMTYNKKLKYSEILLEMTTQISDKLVDQAIDDFIKSNAR